ncbi:proton-conducting transporter membrane subunit [Streptomyces cavernae]|uniref:proton-conducting transporter transmembrane domain-containing protein n=1 Tax=Streptomyces cavernae TaxID=2259034 RepID=UPI001EE4C2C2|nr:proton-conducting transporter membrane subunit [Streptomyces cavernae]
MNDFVLAPVAVLLVGVVLQAVLSRRLSGAAKGWLATGVTTASCAGVVALWPTVLDGEVLDRRLGSWDGPVSLSFHVDGLALLFAFMATSIGAAILLYSVAYMAHDVAATRFYVIMQVFIAGLITLVFAEDLLLMYAGWEIVGLCSFLLVGFWYTDRAAAAGARKVLVMTHSAGYALLAAILVIYARTGTTLWTDPKVAEAFTGGVFVLMLVSAVAKSVQFPLHTWIPSAMAAPTPVSALLHAAVYVKAGVYLVARMHSFGPWPSAWQNAVVWVGTVTMLVGVLFAMIQHDAKRLLAFHTVSQIGYMMLGLGLGTPLGVAAALLHTFNHGLFKGGLFLGAGAVQHATGTRDMDRLGGLSRRMPGTTALWLISAASISGVPLFNGFVSKLLLYVAALQADFTVPALIAWVVSVLTMFSFMKASSALFFGVDGEASAKAHESPRGMLIGSGVLAAGCLVLGIAPQLALDHLIDPALTSMGLRGNLGVGWFGFASAGSSFLAGGLVLALLSVVGGAVVHQRFRRRGALPATASSTTTWEPRELVSAGPAAAALPPVGLGSHLAPPTASFTGGEPLRDHGHLRASDFSSPVSRGLAPFYRWGDADLYYLAVWHATLRVCAVAGRAGAWLERRAAAALTALAVAMGLVALAAADVVRTDEPTIDVTRPWALAATIVTALCGLLLAMATAQPTRPWVRVAAVAGLLVVPGLLVPSELVRVLLLEGAAFGAFLVLVLAGVDTAARNAYLAAAVFSALTLVTGTALIDTAPARVVLALLLAGFAVKLALVPACVWLPAMAARTPAALIGLVVAVVDVAAFAELVSLRQTSPWLFSPTWPWLLLALLSAVGGAALALAQQDVKRMLAFSTVTGAGFLVLGIVLAGEFGLDGAMAGAAADALAMALLFTTLAGTEADRPLTLSSRGVAREHPLAAAGFLIGGLAVLGVPFTAGFSGHWRVYATALNESGPVLALLVVATILSVLAYSRVVALVWWGGAADAPPLPPDRPRSVSVWASEPPPLVIALVGLSTAVLATGLFPRLLQEWVVR